MFTVNFSEFFHLLLSRQAFPLGWLLSFLSSGLSLGPADLNWLCSLFYFTRAPATPSVSWSWQWAFILFLAEFPIGAVRRWSYLLMTRLNLLLYLFSYASANLHFSPTSLLFSGNWVILNQKLHLVLTSFSYLVLKINSSIEIR